MIWYFGEKNGLCIGMARLPFQKYYVNFILQTNNIDIFVCVFNENCEGDSKYASSPFAY